MLVEHFYNSQVKFKSTAARGDVGRYSTLYNNFGGNTKVWFGKRTASDQISV